MKSKPFLIASFVFGGLGLLVLIMTVVSFFSGEALISRGIGSLLGLDKNSFSDATMGQIAVVFFIPAFVFAFRSFADNDEPENSDTTKISVSNSTEQPEVLEPSEVLEQPERLEPSEPSEPLEQDGTDSGTQLLKEEAEAAPAGVTESM